MNDTSRKIGRFLALGFWLCVLGWIVGAYLHDVGVLETISLGLSSSLGSFFFGTLLFARWVGRRVSGWAVGSAAD